MTNLRIVIYNLHLFQHFKWNIWVQINSAWSPRPLNICCMIGGMYFPMYSWQVLMSSPLKPIPGSWQKSLPWSISTAAFVASSLTRRVPTAPTSSLHLSQFQVPSLIEMKEKASYCTYKTTFFCMYFLKKNPSYT